MPGSPVVLDAFGGIVATSRAEDLPEGASPRNNDVDFVVGRFIQRPGEQNVYAIDPTTYGPNGAGNVVDLNDNGGPWTNPNNILLNDGIFTTNGLAGHIGVATVTVIPGTPISASAISTPTAFTTSHDGSATATATDTTGKITANNGTWHNSAKVQWSGFTTPALPAGAVITSMIPTYIIDGSVHQSAFVDFLGDSSLPPFPATFSGTFTGPSIGTSLSRIATWNPWMEFLNSVPFPPLYNDFINVTSVSLVVNYTVPAVGAGGYYALSETPVVVFSGTGSGATATANTTSMGTYKVVSSVTVTAPGSYTGTITVAFTGATNPANNAVGTLTTLPIGQQSDTLRLTNFAFAIPSNFVITGIQAGVKGYSPNATVNVQMVLAGAPVGAVQSYPLPTSNGFVNVGAQSYLWGTTWTPAQVNATTFGIDVWVTSPAAEAVSLDYAQITIYGNDAPASYLGLCSANLDETDQVTLALDSNGLTWEENVTNNPTHLSIQSLIPVAQPGSYMKGLDANGKAYMAYSNLTQGTSQPMQFNGAWCDRITQVGPGTAPVFTPQQTTSTVFPITSITQPAQASYGFVYYLQSSGPGSTSPGNVVTVYYGDSTQPSPVNTDLVNAMGTGFAVYLYLTVSGIPVVFGPLTVLVTSIGLASPPGQPRQFYYFTFVVPNAAYAYYAGNGHPAYVATWTRSLASLQATNPIPGLTVGNQITISGATPAGWDSTWSISQALNSGQMAITSTSVTAGVATYNYSVQTGANPAVGELVTVTGTTNANGALNVAGASIASATGGSTGSFTLNVPVATDFASVPESGQATTAGTLFDFDPGSLVVGTGTTPIFGNTTVGGSLVFEGAAGQFITPGTKQGSVFFITRNGAVVRPAPPVTFVVPANCGAILVNHIPVGPANVIARGITFTESGQNGVAGASFYYYDTAVSFITNGITYTSQALIVPDNTSTSATFAFSDSVLLASDEIDVPGNDYFNLKELGSPTWMFQYADRMLYGQCQTKIDNLLNMSFDGGYLPTYSSAFPMPTGWQANGTGNLGSYTITGFVITSNVVTFDAVNSLQVGMSVLISGLTTGTYLDAQTLVVLTVSGTQFTAAFTHANVSHTADSGLANVNSSSIGLVPSLDFGNAFRMVNYGASAWTSANVLFQPAYQDYLNVNIIQPNTAYSVRVKARSLNADAQTVTIQLPTYANQVFGSVIYGSASFSFNQGAYQIISAPLITGNGLAIVPPSLVVSLGVSAIPIGDGVEIDRIEIYPTNNPVDVTTIWMSYANKFESVDIVTGQLGVGAENPQPATGAFEILEQLYIVKKNSLQVTQDSPNYEPNNWQVRQASDRAGGAGPNAFDEGEEFAIVASRNGLYFFDGGKPMPITRELQSTAFNLNIWEAIYWPYGQTIWVRNDLTNRRLLIGVPMQTPNSWLPKAPTNLNPTSPNVILMCNYTGCPTGEELADGAQVHVTMFGDLKSLDMRRKWSPWLISCPVAEFVPRPDSFTDPLFLCNGTGTGKIYQLVNGAPDGTGQNTDDGAAINWNYCTYGFVKAKQGQQTGMGALRKVWYYLAATMEGVGNVAAKLYSNSLGATAQNTFTIPLQFTLTSPQQNDQERVLEFGGQRMFIEFSSVGTGGYAEVGPVMVDGEVDKNSPHRGVAS